ncbi:MULTISPECIES: chlorohydrolase family protein [unclassified Streptomyces]|uniref:chlorohydrolase family protein n=1 Tax=unclassified Streptomyces TaxID=2593676 RepID=UPI000DB9B7F4|nr:MULTISPECIES: chlorohydrolase family protein [unclassified Streptomyces]MYT75387.1 amidohydrolase family protein [Streptomyces sp. SID8367]RAJ86789.1 cytosine/adenosine deaminase-related metal-dependent hydrolase [Streptomyces sp. PsTaAH-137]
MRTRWRARHILAHQDGGHALLRDGEVVWEDDRVVYVGPRHEGPVDAERDLGESLVLPGLIDLDALTDVDHLVLDSWAGPDRAKGLQWSLDYFAQRRHDVFTPGERATIRTYALAQLALHGITTFMPIASEVHSRWAEPYDELVAMADASRRIGLRGYLGPAYRSGVNVVLPDGTREVAFDEAEGLAGMRDAVRFLDHLDALGDPLLTGVLLPCRIETLTEELLAETARVGRERGVPVRLHALQGLAERDIIQRRHGLTPIELLDKHGLLAPNLLIPHTVLLDRHPAVHGADHGDLDRLARAGISVVHCPQTSLRYGEMLHSFRAYRAAGVNLCLGTDSFPPDLIRGMDVGVHLAKIADGRSDAAPAEHYVEAATLGGARALGRDDLGRIAPGAQADLVAFSLDDIRDGVLDDPVRTFLLNGTARQATNSVVAGRPVLVDGGLPGLDLDALRHEAQTLFERMRAAYSERDTERRDTAALFPPTFPAFRAAGPEAGA